MLNANEMLQAKIVAIAGEIPPAVLVHVCQRLEQIVDVGCNADLNNLTAGLAYPRARQVLGELFALWQQANPMLPPVALAWALRGASLAVQHCADQQKLELVWTGPAPANAGLRRTDQALLDVISHANKRLFIVTFVAYQMTPIIEALTDAAARGVKTTFVIESRAESEGRVEHDGLEKLQRTLKGIADIYVWPHEQREHNEQGEHGTLHVKCAVADARHLLISSANLTGFAMNLNMEMGVLVTGGHLPEQVQGHLLGLIRGRILQQST